MRVKEKDKYNELKKRLIEIHQANYESSSKDLEISTILKEMKKYIELEDIEKDEVEEIIFNIRKKYSYYSNCVERDFLEGGCYYFAYMLKKIYKDAARIYTTCNEKDIHAVVKINDFYYDVRGNLSKQEDLSFEKYRKLESKEEFYEFSNICKIVLSKSHIVYFESVCNKILSEIIGEEILPREELNVKKYRNNQEK